MINNVMLSEQYKDIENDNLLLKIDSLENIVCLCPICHRAVHNAFYIV